MIWIRNILVCRSKQAGGEMKYLSSSWISRQRPTRKEDKEIFNDDLKLLKHWVSWNVHLTSFHLPLSSEVWKSNHQSCSSIAFPCSPLKSFHCLPNSKLGVIIVATHAAGVPLRQAVSLHRSPYQNFTNLQLKTFQNRIKTLREMLVEIKFKFSFFSPLSAACVRSGKTQKCVTYCADNLLTAKREKKMLTLIVFSSREALITSLHSPDENYDWAEAAEVMNAAWAPPKCAVRGKINRAKK